MIDPRAVIDPRARLDSSVEVGPFSIIGPDVEIGAGTWIGPHVVINGMTRIGRDNKIYQFASLGEVPQDKKYAGEATRVEIGDRNLIREYVTINRGTAQDQGVTRIGDDNWIMAYVHIAHDCLIGNQTIFANAASLAGHVIIDDYVILGGFTLISQFLHLGANSFTAMGSVVNRDVPPYVTVSGHMAKPCGINLEGLKRRGCSTKTITQIRQAYKLLYKSKLLFEDAIQQIDAMAADCAELVAFAAFLKNATRGIIR
ncbi:MAG: acyl-ACP--UDP-N-acetylglucosamine O-acyltransferase [Gammaproteobacteria bacterium]